MNNKEKKAAFWKRIREELKNHYGITARTPIGDKKGYQLFNFVQSVAFRFNELDVPKRLTLKCPECGMGFHDTEGGKKGLKRHTEVRH